MLELTAFPLHTVSRIHQGVLDVIDENIRRQDENVQCVMASDCLSALKRSSCVDYLGGGGQQTQMLILLPIRNAADTEPERKYLLAFVLGLLINHLTYKHINAYVDSLPPGG